MKPRVIILISAILSILILNPVSMGTSWEPGEGWGYKWIVTPPEFGTNYTFNGTMEGNNVLGAYVEYKGEDGGVHNFSYFGSWYAYNYINGTLKGNNYTFEREWVKSSTYRWINFEGYFTLKKVNVTDAWNNVHQVYAITHQMIHVYTKQPMRYDMRGHVKWLSKEFNYNINYTLDFDITLKINYSQPLPYIPIENNSLFYYSTLTYNGHIKAKGNGYYIYGDKRIDMNKSLDEDLMSDLQISAKLNSNGDLIERPGIVELIPLYFGWEPPFMFYKLDKYIAISLRGISQKVEAKMDNGFYTSITIPSMVMGEYQHRSTTATEEEIKDIQNNAPEIYGPSSEEKPLFNYTLIAIIAGILIVAVVIIVFLWKKSQRGTT
jgi:hypothetical protein